MECSDNSSSDKIEILLYYNMCNSLWLPDMANPLDTTHPSLFWLRSIKGIFSPLRVEYYTHIKISTSIHRSSHISVPLTNTTTVRLHWFALILISGFNSWNFGNVMPTRNRMQWSCSRTRIVRHVASHVQRSEANLRKPLHALRQRKQYASTKETIKERNKQLFTCASWHHVCFFWLQVGQHPLGASTGFWRRDIMWQL